MKDREASLCVNIISCYEEIPTVKFILGTMFMRGEHLCIPFYLYMRLLSISYCLKCEGSLKGCF